MGTSNILNKSRGSRIGGLVAALALVAGLLTGCNLAPDVALGGQVTSPGGARVGQVTVGVYSDATTQVAQATTDGFGKYEISDIDLTAGTYRVKVGSHWNGGSDYASATAVTITNTPSRLNLTLTDASEVTGTVVDPTNHDPMPNTALVAYDTDGHTVGVAATNSDGTFDLGAPGGATVTIKVLDTTNTLVTLGGMTPTPITTTAGETTAIGTLVVNHPTRIAAGNSHECAVQTDSTVKCWGYNGNGQLGDNSTNNADFPVQVLAAGGTGSLTGVTAVAAGYGHTCALKADTTVVCWGWNGSGQLGNASTTDSDIPVTVLAPGGNGPLQGVTAIAAGYDQSCAVLSGGTVDCWGSNDKGQLGNGIPDKAILPWHVTDVGGSGFLSDVTAITASYKYTCALVSGGAVDCWGSNDKGQLGNDTTSDANFPVTVSGVGGNGTLDGATGITAIYKHTCAALSNGTATCWGFNDSGQLGVGNTDDSHVPVQVLDSGGTTNLTGVTTITAGFSGTCALLTGGKVDCWGFNSDGELGNDSDADSLLPVHVLDASGTGTLTDVTTITSGSYHTCALKTDRSVVCWGMGANGELGNGYFMSSLPGPVLGFPYATIVPPGSI